MSALSEVIQVVDRLQKVADVGLPALQSSLPAIEQAGREMIRRAISHSAPAAQRVASGAVPIGSDVSVDLVVGKLDPSQGLDPKTFTIEGVKDHPWIKEDLSHLSHATAESERRDREQGRGAHSPFINPVPQRDGLVPWAKSEPPRMREGAQRESRHPLMKL